MLMSGSADFSGLLCRDGFIGSSAASYILGKVHKVMFSPDGRRGWGLWLSIDCNLEWAANAAIQLGLRRIL